jgi:glutaminyl-tRNA synthetase
VRLKYAYIIKCTEVIKDSSGNVTELRCTADLESKSGGATSNRKIKGTIHWVSAAQAIDAEVRLYDRLFTVSEPDAEGDFKTLINPHSLEVVTAKCEPSLGEAKPELRYQFERLALLALDRIPAWQARLQSDDYLARYLGKGSNEIITRAE